MPLVFDENRAEVAVRAVMLGMPMRQAARKWNIDRSYIRRRLNGIPTRKETNQHLQAVPINLERRLANWAIGQARLGFAPSIVKLKIIAERMAQASGSPRSLGSQWHTRFLSRNEAVKSARSLPLSYSRVNGATAVNINRFFDRLEAPELAAITPDRFFNIDEMGMAQGVGADQFVITDATLRQTFKKAVEKGEWITVLECISAEGEALPPLLIWKGTHVQSQWFPDRNRGLFEDWRFSCLPNGWTSNEIALKWLHHLFLPHVRCRFGNIWVVLVCDGHDSHTNDDFLWACLSNKVWLLFYEPHCSHVQPLDVGVFGLLKKKLKNELNLTPAGRLGIKPSKKEMVLAYKVAREAVLGVKTITNAWATAGI
ncbi:hypothetical protein RRF57_013332 [Xylaria bambusicola]|uniref:HTH CENPB-type domain-containing protein n=1 Tax=Xylaria bambusicola TaxID=326684 RepID=A0AAN7UWL3_9PEZI